METPQDLIKPLPPSPGGKATSRGPVDAGQKSDGGADFAEAMRVARETQAPDRPSQAEPEDPSEQSVRAREAQDSPEEPVASATQPDAQQGTGPTAAADGSQQTAAAAAAQASIAQVNPEVTAPRSEGGAAAGSILPVAGATASTAASAPVDQDTAQSVAPLGLPPGQVAPGRLAAASLAEASASAGALGQSADEARPLKSQLTPADLVTAQTTSVVDLPTAAQPANSGLTLQAAGVRIDAPATARPGGAGQSAPVALAPTAVALAVDRAIGNAIVERPATGTFKPADLAAQPPVDPARIASAGFVAVALQPAVPEEPVPALSPVGEATASGDAPEVSAWLTVRPDSLAMALAERALDQDAAVQLPLKLDQALQSIDARLQAIVGNTLPAGSQAALDAEAPFKQIAATSDAQANAALQIQPQSTPADNAPEPVSLSLNAPMQQGNRWAAEFGDRMAWIANNRFNSATLQVNPPQLGPIEVRILMSGDQAAVSFVAVQPQTREAIQQALPVLASSLASQGLSLGQTSVGRDHLPQQGGSGDSRSSGGQPSIALGGGGDTDVSAISANGGGQPRDGQGLVDTFA